MEQSLNERLSETYHQMVEEFAREHNVSEAWVTARLAVLTGSFVKLRCSVVGHKKEDT